MKIIIISSIVYFVLTYWFIKSSNNSAKKYKEYWEKEYNKTLKKLNEINPLKNKHKFKIIKSKIGYKLSIGEWKSREISTYKTFDIFIWGVYLGMIIYKTINE